MCCFVSLGQILIYFTFLEKDFTFPKLLNHQDQTHLVIKKKRFKKYSLQ